MEGPSVVLEREVGKIGKRAEEIMEGVSSSYFEKITHFDNPNSKHEKLVSSEVNRR